MSKRLAEDGLVLLRLGATMDPLSATHMNVHMTLGHMTAATLVTLLPTTVAVGVVMTTTEVPATMIEEATVSMTEDIVTMIGDTVTTSVVAATMTGGIDRLLKRSHEW